MADLDPELLKQAEELNTEVTDAATNEALKAAIDEVLAEDEVGPAGAPPGRPPKGEKLRDPLDHDGDGKKGGSKVSKKGGAAPALIAVHVNRDYWDENGERTRKGSIVEVSVEAALDGVEVGALSRVR